MKKYYAKNILLCDLYEHLEELIFESYGMESKIFYSEENYREIISLDYIEVPELKIRVVEGVAQYYDEIEEDYINDYVLYYIQDIDTGETLYIEGYSSMYSALYNFFGNNLDYEVLKCNIVKGD